jgi:hypothetical protein
MLSPRVWIKVWGGGGKINYATGGIIILKINLPLIIHA